MLNSFASYLFGSSESTEEQKVELKESPADHDSSWTVIDLPENLGGTSSSQVEMTPMENLLIEHPSMSVYNSHCSGGSAGEDSDMSSSSNEGLSQNNVTRELRPRTVKGLGSRQAPRRPQAVAERAGLIAHIENVKCVQKSKRYQETRRFTRKGLEKMNKILTRSLRNTNKPSVRRSLKQCPSVSQRKH